MRQQTVAMMNLSALATATAMATAMAMAVTTAPAPAAAPDAKPPIEPGLWSYSANTILTGGKGGQQCVKPEQVDEFLSGPRNRHYRCTYPSRSIGEGKMAFQGECVDKHDRHHYHISVHGQYQPEAFNLSGTVSGDFYGIPIVVPMSIQAKRVSATCP